MKQNNGFWYGSTYFFSSIFFSYDPFYGSKSAKMTYFCALKKSTFYVIVIVTCVHTQFTTKYLLRLKMWTKCCLDTFLTFYFSMNNVSVVGWSEGSSSQSSGSRSEICCKFPMLSSCLTVWLLFDPGWPPAV